MRDKRGRFKGKGKVTRICVQCGIKYVTFYSLNLKFCSMKCKGIASRGICNLSKKELESLSKKYSGKGNPFYGKKHTKNSLKKQAFNQSNGGYIDTNGYHIIIHKYKQYKVHRLVMENKLGRKLKPSEEVHHLDGNRTNNREDNLHLFPNKSEHSKYHIFLEDCVMELLALQNIYLKRKRWECVLT